MPPVLHVRAFEDNYIWIIRADAPDKARAPVAIVDPGDAAPVLEFVEQHRLTPTAILCTHHHGDHVGGVEDILARYPAPVYGPAHERIPSVSHPVGDGARVRLPRLNAEFTILEIPGHTSGHVAYYGNGMLFCGDTLFSGGCGHLFEGTAEQMHASLSRLAALPEDTAVYCGHEYTLANLRFALVVEPANADLRAYHDEVKKLRDQGRCTLPSTIGRERRINPFLRAGAETVRAAAESRAGHRLETEGDILAVIRRWKDGFSS